MMGRLDTDQGQFFYEYSLDDLVPADHLVRKLDAVLDLSGLRDELAPFYSHTGRPSIDPELMLRMLIVGYVFAIRSERQLCSELRVNMAYRWFCRLSLESRIPDHSVFSRARHERFGEADLLRRLFERVVETCIGSGLVGGESLSVDASLIKADVNASRRVAGDEPIAWPDRRQASRAVREYLMVLDEESGEAWHRADGRKRKPPKAISLTDPLAAWVAQRNMRSIFAYHANYLIDHKHGVIVDAEGNRANRVDENRAAVAMVARVVRRFALTPEHLAADAAYGNAKTLKSLVEHGIEPHIPVWDKSARSDGTFSREDFRYDENHDRYICPGGQPLKSTGRVHDGGTLYYRARTHDCQGCDLKARCCPKAPFRRGPRDVDEAARDFARSLAKTEAFERSRRERKKVEMAFAHMKRIFRLDRLRLRGLSGARDEVLLTATAQNLRKLVRYACRPPPALNPA